MSAMSPVTQTALARALNDPFVIARYRTKVVNRGPGRCWPWIGALTGRGHGRFWLGRSDQHDGGRGAGLTTTTSSSGGGTGATDPRRVNVCVIAHRFGFGLARGLTELLATDMVAHTCDEPWCQQPDHWQPSNARHNGQDYARRRPVLGGALRDQRGALARAVAVREAAVAGADVDAVLTAGLPLVDRVQLPLFDTPRAART